MCKIHVIKTRTINIIPQNYEESIAYPCTRYHSLRPIPFGVTGLLGSSLLGWGLLNQFPPLITLISWFFTIVKTLVTYWISCSYLTGVAAAQLRWHLSNMNVMQIILTGTFARSKILLTEKLTNGAVVTPTPGAENRILQKNEIKTMYR